MPQIKKPAVIRALEGNRSKRPITRDLATKVIPQPPLHLTPVQRERWDDVVASLPDGLLSRADNAVLERMAIAWALFRETSAVINQSGLLTRGDHGVLVRNPLLIVRNGAAQEMHECGQALGLSPLARTRITNPDADETVDPFDLLL